MSTEVAPSNPTPRASYELENRSSATWNRNVDDKVEVVLPSKDLECPDIRPASIDDSSAISTRHSYPPTMPINESSKPTKEQVMRGRLYFGAVCFSFFLGGWNDAATGPLLPAIQRVYDLNFTVVSLLFMAASGGFAIGGFLNMKLADRFGLGMTMFFGAISQIIGYTVQSTAPPFPLMAIAAIFNGFGWGVQMAQGTGYAASLEDNSAKLGWANAAYGVGALTVPLVSTQFSQMPHWSFHYLTSLGIAVLNAVSLASIIRFRRQEELYLLAGQTPAEPAPTAHNSNKFARVMRLKETHILATWAFLYVGIEVTTGGWINTYLIELRGAGPSAGYVATGFWAGLTVGRIAFMWLNQRVGERRVIYGYSACAIGLELTVWFVPSLIQNAIAVSLVGLFLGPMFPIAMKQTGKIVPRVLLSGAIGWISSIGQVGSAVLPFLTGALASRFGISSLQPFILSMMGVMVLSWAFVPNKLRRLD